MSSIAPKIIATALTASAIGTGIIYRKEINDLILAERTLSQDQLALEIISERFHQQLKERELLNKNLNKTKHEIKENDELLTKNESALEIAKAQLAHAIEREKKLEDERKKYVSVNAELMRLQAESSAKLDFVNKNFVEMERDKIKKEERVMMLRTAADVAMKRLVGGN